MAKRKVDAYALAWRAANDTGRVKLRFVDGNTHLIEANAADFSALSAILIRGDAYFDDESGILSTSWEGDW